MFAIIRTRWQTRPLSRRAKRRSSAAPGSLRKKYAGIVHPPNMVRSLINSTTSGDHWKPVTDLRKFLDTRVFSISGHVAGASYRAGEVAAQATAQSERTRPGSVANRFQAVSQASMMSARLGNTELASQWLRR